MYHIYGGHTLNRIFVTDIVDVHRDDVFPVTEDKEWFCRLSGWFESEDVNHP